MPQNAAIDVYALGNALYKILTGNESWPAKNEKDEEKQQQQQIIDGKLPKLPPRFLISTDPIDQVFVHVIYEMCFIYKPEERATAVHVANYMQEKAIELGIQVK